MTVYSVNSETEWNQLARQSVYAALTSSDIVRIDTSFSFTAYPETVYLGAGLLNGKTNTITFNIATDKGGDVNMISLAGGTVRTLKVRSTNTGTATSYLITAASYGTIRNCEFTDLYLAGPNSGTIISQRSSTNTLTLSRLKFTNITTSADGGAAVVGGVTTANTNIAMSNCSISFNASALDISFPNSVIGRISNSTVSNCTAVSTAGASNAYSHFFGNASSGTLSINNCRFVCGTTYGYFSLVIGDPTTNDEVVTVTDCISVATQFFAFYVFDNVNFTRCVLLEPTATAFANQVGGLNPTITACVSSTTTKSVSGTTILGTLTDATAFSGAGATAGFGFTASGNWSDAASGVPLLNAFLDTNEFTGGYTAATDTTVVRVAITTEADAGGLTASTPTSGHTWHGLGLTLASQSTITITSVTDWTDLVTATASAPLASGQTIVLGGNLTFVTAPGTLNIFAGKFDGMGYTITLFYAGTTHVPLVSVEGGVVTNVNITNQFLSSSGTAVVATAGSYGTFKRLRLTGNCLTAGIVLRGVANKTTTIRYCSFDGNVVDNYAGGLFSTSGSLTLGESYGQMYEEGVSGITFVCELSTSRARLYGASNTYQGAIACCLPSRKDTNSSISTQVLDCCSSVLYTRQTGTASGFASLFHEGTVQRCYCLISATTSTPMFGQIGITYTQPGGGVTPGTWVFRDCYYVNTTAASGYGNLTFQMGGSTAVTYTLTNFYFITGSTNYMVDTRVSNLVLSNVYFKTGGNSALARTTPFGGLTTTGTLKSVALLNGSGGAALLNV